MMSYGATLKPGDKAILRTGAYGSNWAKAHDGKVVIVEKRVLNVGWYIEGHNLWFRDEQFEPADEEKTEEVMKVSDAPTGTRVRCTDSDKAHITGVVVRKEDIDKYPGPNKPSNWDYDAVIRVDDGMWYAHWLKGDEPFFRWATNSYWSVIKGSAISVPVESSDPDFCNCDFPDLVTNTACGKEFQFCRLCRKEKI